MNLKSLFFAFFIFGLCYSCGKEVDGPKEAEDDDILKVLMIGNSHTYYNQLPKTLTEFLQTEHDSVFLNNLTPGGFHFMDHAADEKTSELINSENWDFVILQECADMAAESFADASVNIYPHAGNIINLIKKNNEGSEVIFYMTHAYSGGADWCVDFPQLCDFDRMINEIRRNYLFLSNKHSSKVAPAGMIWKMLRDNNSEIILHDPDTIHPNELGSYISALTIATAILGQELLLNETPGFLTQNQVNDYSELISKVVIDGIPDWKEY